MSRLDLDEVMRLMPGARWEYVPTMVAELRAARKCVERLRDHIDARNDEQFLGNDDYAFAALEIAEYDATKGAT